MLKEYPKWKPDIGFNVYYITQHYYQYGYFATALRQSLTLLKKGHEMKINFSESKILMAQWI